MDLIVITQCTLGDPEHTAVIISDSPVPDRLGEDLDPDNQPEIKPYELESITVIEQSAGQVSVCRGRSEPKRQTSSDGHGNTD